MEKENKSIVYLNINDLKKSGIFSADEELVLDHINQNVADGNTLEEVIDFIFSEIQRIMPCDRIDIGFLEDGGNRLMLHYVKADYEQIFLKAGYISDIIGSPVQKIFQTGYPSIVNDLEQYYREMPYSTSTMMLQNEGINSTMACPLMVEGRPVGLLFCRAKKKNAYFEHEIFLQHSFAERLSQAVDKAFRIDQLSTAMKSYLEMLGFISHELKSPLASMITLGKTLASGYFGEISKKHKDIVDRMVKKAEYLHNLTIEYLNLARFESGQLQLHPKSVDFINDILLPAEEIVSDLMEESKIIYKKEIPAAIPPITCDPELMKIVLVNLLGNAVKYGNIGGKVILSIILTENRIRISVWNEGPGFPEDKKIKLFRKFSKLDVPELNERKGHGVGLYVTWQIVQLHGGRIWAESEYGKWAEFLFEASQNLDHCIIEVYNIPKIKL